jgi:hypothetical protein
MISFPAIESREEENFAMEERRLGWNEEGGRQGFIGRGQNLISIGSVRGNM